MTKKGPARAYVFDYDGTLGTIPVDWVKVRNGLADLTGSQEVLKRVFPTILHIIERDPSMQRKIFEVIDQYELEGAPMAALYPGARELLSKLSLSSKLSLVTMQGNRATKVVLESLDLKQYFIRWFTREDSLDRAEQIRFALQAMGAKKESSTFVGDRLNDLRAAKSVGVPFTMIRTHGEDPTDRNLQLYHSIKEFLDAITLDGEKLR